MRLINIDTREIKSFPDNAIPDYAILSHRWGPKELSYKEYASLCAQIDPTGWNGKIFEFLSFLRAVRDNKVAPEWYKATVQWAWIDTCCIDIDSSSELSEAINSMYRYYRDAKFCVGYLIDVENTGCEENHQFECLDCDMMLHQLRGSDWFKRGWTLQELIAPNSMVFVTATWKVIGWKSFRAHHDLIKQISAITGIPTKVLYNPNRLDSQSIAQRFSWASRRVTTEVEDEAYCLLGLLDVNLPLLYGEGRKAWRRLQEEVLRSTQDESIFAWFEAEQNPETEAGILCPQITAFATACDIRRRADFARLPFVVTNQGLELRLQASTAWTSSLDKNETDRVLVMPLNCMIDSVEGGRWRPCLLVLGRERHCNHYARLTCLNVSEYPNDYAAVNRDQWHQVKDETIYVHLFGTCDTRKTRLYISGDRDAMKTALSYLMPTTRADAIRSLEAGRAVRFADPAALAVREQRPGRYKD